LGECLAADGCLNPARGNEVAAIPTNLPQEQNSFVGREHELGQLRQLLDDTRALTLCGTGGIGKTRLAMQVLAAVVDEFPDGVWFVELGDLQQPDLVVSRVAAAVGVGEEPGRPLVDTLADALRPRRLLLALDNCEHLIDACARVCQRLLASSPGLRLIATSREPLRVAAETVWQVRPLSVAPDDAALAPEDALRYEAIRLFATRAAASLPGFAIGPANSAAVAALCRALDGVPLAIELAAAWVRTLSVEQIAARLADRLPDGAAPPAHPARRDGLELRAPHRLRAGAAAAAFGLRRLVAGDGGAGVFRRHPRGRGRAGPAGLAGGQVAGGAGARGAR
jgi:predicted ATPase